MIRDFSELKRRTEDGESCKTGFFLFTWFRQSVMILEKILEKILENGKRRFFILIPIPSIFILYLCIINLAAFFLMASDKRRARKGLWRIPEKTLFLSAVLGGSAGALLGMYIFHHKTRHWYFVIGMPLILILQAAAGIWLIWLR